MVINDNNQRPTNKGGKQNRGRQARSRTASDNNKRQRQARMAINGCMETARQWQDDKMMASNDGE